MYIYLDLNHTLSQNQQAEIIFNCPPTVGAQIKIIQFCHFRQSSQKVYLALVTRFSVLRSQFSILNWPTDRRQLHLHIRHNIWKRWKRVLKSSQWGSAANAVCLPTTHCHRGVWAPIEWIYSNLWSCMTASSWKFPV